VPERMIPQDLRATLYFLRKDDLYGRVKPYSLEYTRDDINQSNLKTDKVKDLLVKDLRGVEHEFTFEKNGFAVLEMDSAMSYENFDDPVKVENVYCQELGKCLLKYMQATSVQIFDTTVRPLALIPLAAWH
jgi:hypothetical protein